MNATHPTPPAANQAQGESPNAFRTAARAVKAAKLTAAIDGAFQLLGINDAETRYDCVCGMADPGWASAAAQAGTNLPSEETRRIVIDTYGLRVKHAFDAQIASAVAAALKAASHG